VSKLLGLCFAIASLQLQVIVLCTTLASLQVVVGIVDKLPD